MTNNEFALVRNELALVRSERDALRKQAVAALVEVERFRRLLAEYDNRRMGRCNWCGGSGSHEESCEVFHKDGSVR